MSYQRYVERRGANHGLHVFLTIITCGLWAISGWPIAAAMGRKTVTKVPTYYPSPPMPQQQYAPPPYGQQPPQAYYPQQPGPYNQPPTPQQQPRPRHTSWGQQ